MLNYLAESGHGLGLTNIQYSATGELMLAGKDGYVTWHNKDMTCKARIKAQHYRAGGITAIHADPFGNILTVR